MGGTDLDHAYENCAAISERLGGIAVETSFNGVKMFFHRQSKEEWINEYKRRIFGCPLHILCPYAARTNYKDRSAK